MPTSPSSHVCIKLELWKLVLKKYFLYVEYYVLRALGGDPYLILTTTHKRNPRATVGAAVSE
jgi:hypothetical protein